jgi:hypothetical protein
MISVVKVATCREVLLELLDQQQPHVWRVVDSVETFVIVVELDPFGLVVQRTLEYI